MIHVIAFIGAKPGKRVELLELFRANMAAVRAEQGCIEYAPVIDVDALGKFQTMIGDDSFVVIEKWASKEALGAHAVAPHMKEYAKASRDLVESRTIHVFESAS